MARTRLYPPSVDPGFPELPETPEGWRRTTFGDVLEVVSRPIKLNPTTKYRLVNAKRSRGGITLRDEVLGREVLTKTQFEAKAGDFLISRRQIIHGACGVVPDALDGAVVSNEYSTLRTRPTLLMEYLRHYSHTPYFQRTCFHSSHGVDVEKMIFKIEQWLAREVDLPPLPEQRKIAAILSAVDAVIEKTEAVIESLQALKKAMMQELLTRGLPGRHTRFKQTEIGEVPEEWDLRLIDALGPNGEEAVRTGPFGSSLKTKDFQQSGHPILTIQSLGQGEVLHDGLFFVANDKAEELADYAVRPNDVVFSRVADIGRCVAIGKAEAGWIISSNLSRIRLDESKAHAEFLMYLLTTAPSVLRQVEVVAGNAGRPVITSTTLRALQLPIPPLHEQAAIARIGRTIEQRVRAEAGAFDALRLTKSALMSVLLTGELRVTPDQDVA